MRVLLVRGIMPPAAMLQVQAASRLKPAPRSGGTRGVAYAAAPMSAPPADASNTQQGSTASHSADDATRVREAAQRSGEPAPEPPAGTNAAPRDAHGGAGSKGDRKKKRKRNSDHPDLFAAVGATKAGNRQALWDAYMRLKQQETELEPNFFLMLVNGLLGALPPCSIVA